MLSEIKVFFLKYLSHHMRFLYMYLLINLSSKEDSVKLAHMRRLARAFAAHIHEVWMFMKA